MKRRAPPLGAIEAFIVAARTANFRAAADELALSPSALSRRILALEDFLGVALFDRTGSRPRLNQTGMRYREEVQPAIDAICRSSLQFRAHKRGGPLRVLAPQSLAEHWLVPRLPEFIRDSGGIEVELRIGRDVSVLGAGLADVGVVSGPRPLGGLPRECLIELEATVMAAPQLLDGRVPPSTLHDIGGHRLLSVREPPRLWDDWLHGAGYQAPPPPLAAPYDTLAMTYEAAAAGFGLVLGVPLHTNRFLENGRLRACLAPLRPTGHHYALVYADEAVRRRPDVRRFAGWLGELAAQSQARFRELAQAA